MANENESASLKRSFFTELKGEFRKIIWPDKKLLGKQSVAVIVAAIVIGCIIAAIDWLFQIGLSFIIGLGGEHMAEVESNNEARWYVAHTYSGYENKVKVDIEQTIENRKLQDQIFEVLVPVQEVVELKDGRKRSVSKKIFPGYVLINMIMNDATWYVVRNTRGVTGFVGPGSKPVPLTEQEMKNLGIRVPEMEIDVELGDTVKVVAGAWEGTVGTITDINTAKQSVTIEVDIFGRATSVEISFMDVSKLD